MKPIRWWLLAVCLLFPLAAKAQQHVIVDKGFVVNTGINVLETIACNSGVSPCTIGAVSTTVLNANVNRHECLLQNIAATDFYCIKGAGTASAANLHFILKAATGAAKGDGGSYSCSAGPVVWTGVVVCISSAAAGSLAVSAD